MLRGRVVQFLRYALPFVLLKIDKALGKLLCLLLQNLLLRDVSDHPDKTRRLASFCELVLAVDPYPTLQAMAQANAANRVKFAISINRLLARPLELLDVIGVKVIFDEHPSGERAVRA